jgi:hypothetical protein
VTLAAKDFQSFSLSLLRDAVDACRKKEPSPSNNPQRMGIKRGKGRGADYHTYRLQWPWTLRILDTRGRKKLTMKGADDTGI